MNVEFKLVRTKRKTTALFVLLDGSLLVRAPLHTSRKLIDGFVVSKKDWIEKQRAKLTIQMPQTDILDYEKTKKVAYLGRNYPLEISERAFRHVEFDGKRFILARTNAIPSTRLFENWYRSQARRYLMEKISWFGRNYNLQPKKLRITSARTRWGSCSSKGTVSFTWRLMMAPPHVIEYVVVHELVHLVENNHQKPFWNKVAEILPDFKERRSWLRKNSSELMNKSLCLDKISR